ncbi:MAG: histidine phosphatase family protein [Alphaproteobacteria bacterium]|nr:histidine phosphatase family protein [Alphaproteobacteria bacterium]
MIFLVRHGETEWNRIGRYQGWSDSPLTERGLAQAAAIGQMLRATPEAAAAEIIASPLGRARRTAEIIAGALDGRPIRFDDRLREISLGSWDGLDRAEVRARLAATPGGYRRHEWYFNSPHGESYSDFAGRVGAWLRDTGDAPVIAVAHGIVTRVLRGLYAGLPRDVALQLNVAQDCAFLLHRGIITEIAA